MQIHSFFRCQGTLNGVSWRLPTDATESMRRRITIRNDINHQHFIAELVIRDVGYKDTGTLTCAYNGTHDLNAIDNSSRYDFKMSKIDKFWLQSISNRCGVKKLFFQLK